MIMSRKKIKPWKTLMGVILREIGKIKKKVKKWRKSLIFRAHNPKVSGSNPDPATMRTRGYVSDITPFFSQRRGKP